jgi:hypothetical protein
VLEERSSCVRHDLLHIIEIYLRTECEKTFFAQERIIWGMSDEGASASFARMCRIGTSSRIEVYTIFLKRTLCLICCIPFVNRWCLSMRLPKCIKLCINSDLFSLFRNFQLPNWEMAFGFCKPDFIIIKSNYIFSECSNRRMLFGWFWSTSARNLRSRLTVAVAKCHVR